MPLDSAPKTKYLKRSHGSPRRLSKTYAEILGLARRNCDKSNRPPTGAFAIKRLDGNGESKDVSGTNKIQIMQRPSTIDREKLLLRNATTVGDRWPGVCAIKCSCGSPKRNPRRACESWHGHYHLSKI